MTKKPKPEIRRERIPMRKQKPEERIHNFNEVALGYTEEEAVAEAQRCLQCPQPRCVQGCPVEIEIPAFIELICKGRFMDAIKKIKEKNKAKRLGRQSRWRR